jgi:hypothetical protein
MNANHDCQCMRRRRKRKCKKGMKKEKKGQNDNQNHINNSNIKRLKHFKPLVVYMKCSIITVKQQFLNRKIFISTQKKISFGSQFSAL